MHVPQEMMLVSFLKKNSEISKDAHVERSQFPLNFSQVLGVLPLSTAAKMLSQARAYV